jgi:hypothetical protein
MIRLGSVLVALALAGGVAAAAQEPAAETLPRKRSSVEVAPPRGIFKMMPNERGRMGITLNIRPQPTDSIGALIDAVTPGGPAYRSGIVAGDIVTTFNGKSLVTVARETRRPTPGLVMIEMASELKAGDTARVEYRRGRDRPRRANVVLETMTPFMEPLQYGDMEPSQEFGAEFFPPEMYVTGDDEPRVFERSPSRTFTFFATPISDLELAPMNPALGQYFGVTEGVLVINVPARTRLNLRPGDVVLSVDGRRVSNPNQLFRALLSYDPNESIQIEVQRMKRRDTVTGQVGPD